MARRSQEDPQICWPSTWISERNPVSQEVEWQCPAAQGPSMACRCTLRMCLQHCTLKLPKTLVVHGSGSYILLVISQTQETSGIVQGQEVQALNLWPQKVRATLHQLIWHKEKLTTKMQQRRKWLSMLPNTVVRSWGVCSSQRRLAQNRAEWWRGIPEVNVWPPRAHS